MEIDKEKRDIPFKRLDDGDHGVTTGQDHFKIVTDFIVVDGQIVRIDSMDDGDGPL